VLADDISTQDFNDLSTGTYTTDSLPDGSQLTNSGSYNIGGPGIDFRTYWFDTRGETNGPVTTNESSDYIGVNDYTGGGAPNVAPDGTLVGAGEHNFQFNDGDGRLDLVFDAVDISGYINRQLLLSYWINDTGYESDDTFSVTLTDGTNSQSYLNYGETELEANASADDGTANWNSLVVDLEALIDAGFSEVLTLTISVDTNSGSENIFVDDIAFVGAVPSTNVNKTVTPGIPLAGELVTYTVQLHNPVAEDDTGLFTDTLPSEVEFARWVEMPSGASLNPAQTEITWSGIVTAGESITFTFVTTNTAASGIVTNTAQFSGTKAVKLDRAVFTVPSISLIHDIQGSGLASPEDGNIHTVEGIVVGEFQASDELRGFFLQEEDADADTDPLTSEGIFVVSSSPVAAGNQVRVRGTVDEYFGLTQLGAVSDVVVVDSGLPMPTAAQVTLPFSSTTYLERYEGMAVKVMQPLYVTENYNLGRGGLLDLSSDGRLMQPTQVVTPGTPANDMAQQNSLDRLILDDGSTSQNPDPIIYPRPYLSATNSIRSGDIVSDIVGVLTYSWSGWGGTNAYRIHPTDYPTIISQNPRPTSAPDVEGDLKVVSLNVYNYFDTFSGCTEGVGGDPTGCRGADDATEFMRQRDKIINAIVEMDADVIGLQEIENDGYADGNSAIDDLVDGVNAIAGTGTYTYVNVDAQTGVTNALGLDAIKVGCIYKTETVAMTGTTQVVDNNVDPNFHDDYNRPALVQSFEYLPDGEVFTVVVNHLKSKGSDCDAIGDPDEGDGQGNCNLTRTSAVTVTLNYLATDPTGVNDTDVLIIGDLNAYAMEDPIKALEDAGYVNLVENQYTYAFFGQWGTLDYAFASPSMVDEVMGAAPWHINADEPNVLNYNTEYKSPAQVNYLYSDAFYRVSDHDPVMVSLKYSWTLWMPIIMRNAMP